MNKLHSISVSRADGKIKEINFKIKVTKDYCDQNSFAYRDYKLSDLLPDDISVEEFMDLISGLIYIEFK